MFLANVTGSAPKEKTVTKNLVLSHQAGNHGQTGHRAALPAVVVREVALEVVLEILVAEKELIPSHATHLSVRR